VSSASPDSQALMAEMLEFGRRLGATLTGLGSAAHTRPGCSAKQRVWGEDKVALYRYEPLTRPAGIAPVLICYALVNRPYMMDLQADRSLIRGFLNAGLDVYLIDWGYPDGADRLNDLDDYINGYLHRCVQHVLDSQQIAGVNLLGVCQGGTFSLCYTALHPQHVKNLITMVTPVDFKTPENLLSKWVQGLNLDLLVQGGNVSGDCLNGIYLSLMPFRLTQQKYIDLVQAGEDQRQLENFMRMERWIFDSPDQAAAALRQFIQWFYQENRLVDGSLMLGKRQVDLRRIVQPVLNIYASKDHLVPPSASVPLARLVGSADYTPLAVDVGHIGMYVSARAQQEVPSKIAAWLGAREKPRP
jgi:polyhydroxyalkanoate synthase